MKSLRRPSVQRGPFVFWLRRLARCFVPDLQTPSK
jgi:hypothetical protein